MSTSPGSPRDRKVALLMVVLVVGVLALNLASAFIPGMDGSLAAWPVIIAVLIGGTLVVLAGALRR